jgi:hypothetical protein
LHNKIIQYKYLINVRIKSKLIDISNENKKPLGFIPLVERLKRKQYNHKKICRCILGVASKQQRLEHKQLIRMGIRQNILEKIREPRMRAKIVLASPKDITDSTVVRWINKNDDSLTKEWCLKLIEDELGMKRSQFFEKEPR